MKPGPLPQSTSGRRRSGHLLLALLENEDLARLAREIADVLQKISEDLHKHLPDLVRLGRG